MFLAPHRHRKLSAFHHQQFLASVGRNADVVGLADSHRTGGYRILGNGLTMLCAGDTLSCAERQLAADKQYQK